MKYTFYKYLVFLIIALGGLTHLNASAISQNESITPDSNLENNAVALSTFSEIAPFSSDKESNTKKIISDLTIDEEIEDYKKDESQLVNDSISTIFFYTFLGNIFIYNETLTLGVHKTSSSFIYKRYIKFEVFRI
jgi:hypothetical protein